MKIAMGADHRGFALKEQLKDELKKRYNYEIIDCGTDSEERCDFPVFAFAVSEIVSHNNADYGVVICGSGDGVCVASNKVKGIRCTLVVNHEDAHRAKAHINANVIAIGSEKTDLEEAIKIVNTFVDTEFLDGRYKQRIDIISEYENEH